MFETLLQVMSNDGFEVIICSATQTSFNGVNNTGGEANLKKCMLLCLIQTSVTLAIIKARKVTILKDYVLMDILKEVDVGDYDSSISEEVAELYDFRKKIGTCQPYIQFYIIIQDFMEVISIISDLDMKRASEVNRKTSA